MTPQQIAEIRERANAATEGPWRADTATSGPDDWPIMAASTGYLSICPDCGTRGGMDRPDAEFVAHAREDVPALLAEVERLQDRLGRARAALVDLCRRRRTMSQVDVPAKLCIDAETFDVIKDTMCSSIRNSLVVFLAATGQASDIDAATALADRLIDEYEVDDAS